MVRKLNLIAKLFIISFTARSQGIPFDQLPFSNALHTDIDSIIHEQVRTFFSKTKASGIMIGITRGGDRTYYSYGYADTANKSRWDPFTMFEIGSITKTFTANLLFQLDGKKIVKIENSLADYIPEVNKNDTVLSKVLLKNIVNHTSGLPRLPANFDKLPTYTIMQPYEAYLKEHLYQYLRSLKRIKPGRYEYSNLGFGILSTIMENETGKTYEELLREYIWLPFRMTNTYVTGKVKYENRAVGYFTKQPAEYWEFDCLAGAGAIKSTTTNMLNYLEGNIQTRNRDIAKAIERITVPTYPISPDVSIASGWHTFENLRYRTFWHNGGTYGFSTFCAFEPKTKSAVIIACNSFNVNSQVDKLGTDIMILLTGK